MYQQIVGVQKLFLENMYQHNVAVTSSSLLRDEQRDHSWQVIEIDIW